MTKPLKILSLPVDEGGCGWYRVRQPFEIIKAYTESDAYVLTSEDDGIKFVQAAKSADVALVRQGGEAAIDELKKYPEFNHLKWILDIDDNIELISPYSQHYAEYGTEEYFDKGTGKWLWKNGEQGFDLAKNRTRVASLLHGMRTADLVTTTTDYLADYARQYNRHVAVLPNCVDPAAWWPVELVPHKQLRVGWNGGVSHYEDWYSIRKPLNELMRKHRFKLVMAGSHYDGLIDPDNRELVEVLPWVPFKAHSYRMMALDLDLALIPLADLPFNRYKSEIKLVEMSAMAVPSVVSNVGPYAEALPRLTALPYTNEQTFTTAMETLLTNPARRHEIGKKARKDAMKHYDAKANASKWVDAYTRLLTT